MHTQNTQPYPPQVGSNTYMDTAATTPCSSFTSSTLALTRHVRPEDDKVVAAHARQHPRHNDCNALVSGSGAVVTSALHVMCVIMMMGRGEIETLL